jgi:DNA mismatch repair protein MutL
MPIIRQMDARLADMIAAGEVVDRPASIIKELVENSIDAKATSIAIEVFEYGMKSITVIDNGIGMDQEDAHMAIKRHATSKIYSDFDLTSIKTLGFRGEALAAIASVSKLSLKTRQKDQEGYQVIYHGGTLIQEGKTACNVGTSISIFDLFYNTPARFKYIKSDIAEKNQIIDIFDRLALANKNIRMKLSIDGKLIKETFGNGNDIQLIDQIYGNKSTLDMVVFESIVSKMKIKGFCLSPSFQRSRKKDISIFLNGRYIKNYSLIQAVVDGYHGYLMTGKFPIAIIHVDIDSSLIDVNVHPQKIEVKISNEMLLAYQIEELIKKHLNQTPHQSIVSSFFQKQKETFTQPSLDLNTFEKIEEEKTPYRAPKLPEMEYLASLAGTYLLFQNEEGLFMVDQHAAEERIRYEYYYEALGNPKNISKHLLIPKRLDLIMSDLEVLRNHRHAFINLGFDFNQEEEIIMTPTWLLDQDIDFSIESFISMIQEKNQIDLKKFRDDLSKSIACKKSIKANQLISRSEVNHLMKSLNECNNPYHCPHGRPTIIKMSYYEIEKLFKRVV